MKSISKSPTAVYSSLAEPQLSSTDWDFQPIIAELHRWQGIFTSEFKLDISSVALRIGGAKSNCYGHFRPSPNDFGIAREIAFNEAILLHCIANGMYFEVLGTLLHELLHAWQHDVGRPSNWNHHNLEFRRKAEELGLIVDHRGITTYAPKSPFVELLHSFSVGTALLELPVSAVPPKKKKGSKLLKWSCGCTNVRVAIADFRASCLKCNRLFVKES